MSSEPAKSLSSENGGHGAVLSAPSRPPDSSRQAARLLATRAITGLAIGGGIPLLYSLVSDLVDVSRRTEAAGALAIATSLGVASGQALAGFLGRCTSLGWRFPFLLVSVPGLLLSVVVLVATEDPPRSRLERGLQEHFSSGGEYNMRPDRKSLGLLATTPTALMAIFQGIPGCVPGGVFAVYLNDFLHRDRGLTIEQATVVLLTYRLAGVLGQYLGSMVGQRLYNTSPRLQPTLMGVTLMMGTVPSLLIVRYSGGVFGLYVSFSALAGFLLAVTGPNVRSILMNVTLPSTRGTAFGVFNLSDDVGRGLGPAIVSMIVERRGRERAFTNTMAAWVLCGIVLLSMAFTLERDERTVQNFLRDNVRANHREQLDEDLETTLLMNDDKSCGLNEEMGVAYSGNVVENSRVERFS